MIVDTSRYVTLYTIHDGETDISVHYSRCWNNGQYQISLYTIHDGETDISVLYSRCWNHGQYPISLYTIHDGEITDNISDISVHYSRWWNHGQYQISLHYCLWLANIIKRLYKLRGYTKITWRYINTVLKGNRVLTDL